MKPNKLWIPAVFTALLPAVAAQAYPGYGYSQPWNTANPAGSSYLDLYYVPNVDLHVQDPVNGNGSDSGLGGGARGQVVVAPNFALSGEYEQNNYDHLDNNISRFSAGAGFVGYAGGLYAEYTGINFPGDHLDGLGLHGRLNMPVAPRVNLFGDAGYLLGMRDNNGNQFEGPDLSAGISVGIAPQLSLFGEYRYTRLDGPGSVQYEFDEVRTGLRFNFGGFY